GPARPRARSVGADDAGDAVRAATGGTRRRGRARVGGTQPGEPAHRPLAVRRVLVARARDRGTPRALLARAGARPRRTPQGAIGSTAMRTRPRLSRSRTAIVALALTSVVLAACTSSGDPSAPRARADEPVDEGLTEEIAEQQEVVAERSEALEAATEAETVGIVEDIHRDPSPGWAGERIVDRTGNDWEPSIAADPNAPYVYILHNRYGGEDACASGCPDPAMILHVSDDGGATWQPEHFLCRCKGIGGQFDPLIEVVPDTGDVVAVWMNGFKIQFARSADHGETWTKPAWIHPDVKWGDKPNLAVSPDGQDVYVQFNGPTGGDAYAAVSHDGGVTWSTTKITDGDRYYFDYGGAVLPNGVVVFTQISFSY